jgi:hypothetical protein
VSVVGHDIDWTEYPLGKVDASHECPLSAVRRMTWEPVGSPSATVMLDSWRVTKHSDTEGQAMVSGNERLKVFSTFQVAPASAVRSISTREEGPKPVQPMAAQTCTEGQERSVRSRFLAA